MLNRTHDIYGQRVYQQYGIGTTMLYTYDPDRRWLEAASTINSSRNIIDSTYTQDAMVNITAIANNGQPAATSSKRSFR